ncbi:hypothetical protein [Pelagicoccus sp. SDUM812005]|uniref:hypothetical protein n=1 Tax=Pelagicoccus sp. SDUM812005 TaxID=3041257 RepID=UPI00280CC434|nr:hypothetical protein [Pelagicoccus sp. SDUM812005]MDQ8180315.1 hypothetical protein [Pelagicoccus sp. SDUM812005]
MNAWLTEENEDLEQQAETFAAVLTTLLEHRENGAVGWNVWISATPTPGEATRTSKVVFFKRD